MQYVHAVDFDSNGNDWPSCKHSVKLHNRMLHVARAVVRYDSRKMIDELRILLFQQNTSLSRLGRFYWPERQCW
jgi:hypothetical protein